jgi:hypothetical protein
MTAIVLRQQEQAELLTFAKAVVGSQLFTQQGITSVERAAVAMVAGREIGLGPIEAIRSFHFANGGVQPSADLLARLIRRHPRYDYRVLELTDEVCALHFFDREQGELREGVVDVEAFVSRFTIEDAQRAGLGKRGPSGAPSSWERYPRNMLFSRAMTNGVAWFAPDVIDALRADPSPQGVDGPLLEEALESTSQAAPADGHAEMAASSSTSSPSTVDDGPQVGMPVDGEPTDPEAGEADRSSDRPKPEVALPVEPGSDPSLPETEGLWNSLVFASGGSVPRALSILNRATLNRFTERTVQIATAEEIQLALSSLSEEASA